MNFVYSNKSPNYDDFNAINYCNKYLYLFSFWFINSTIIAFASVVTILFIIWLICIPLSYFSFEELNRSLSTRIIHFFGSRPFDLPAIWPTDHLTYRPLDLPTIWTTDHLTYRPFDLPTIWTTEHLTYRTWTNH
jgi:hypothetical protein